jgi:hypothetical protein
MVIHRYLLKLLGDTRKRLKYLFLKFVTIKTNRNIPEIKATTVVKILARH